MVYVKQLKDGLELFKALGSDIRLEVLDLLAEHGPMNMNELAGRLGLTNGAVTMHVRKLEDCGLLAISTGVGKHGLQKLCQLREDKLIVDLHNGAAASCYEAVVQVGHYSNYRVQPTCGLATKDRIVGHFDDPRYFADPLRIEAGILWLTRGFLEYRLPNYLTPNQRLVELQISLELGSEAPGYCDNWPSDIAFLLNDVLLGQWTSPGDFGGVRGLFNPPWWPSGLNQYGLLKLIRLTRDGCYIDGTHVSSVTPEDLALDYRSELRFRLAIPDNQKQPHGLTLFGRHFGNYEQDIAVRLLYEEV